MASTIRRQRLTLSLPRPGDFAQGVAASTEQVQNANLLDANVTPRNVIAPEQHNAPWAQPVPVWIALVAILFASKYFIEKGGAKDEYFRIGFGNMLLFFFLWVVVANVSKWIFGFWRLPGISNLVLAA